MVEKVDIKQSLVRFLDLAKTHPGEEEVLNLLAEIEKKIRRTLNPENTNIEEIDFALHLIAEGILRARAKTNVELAEILNGDELGVDAMLSYLWERLEILMKGFDPEETAKLCERLHIEYHKLKRVILIPDEIEKNEGGESKPKEEKELSVSKLKILIHLLKEMGVHTDDLIVVEGIVTKRMMREKSYLAIEIPRLNRMVLLNEGYGEASFVLDLSDRAGIFLEGKLAIEEAGAIHITFTEGKEDAWRENMKRALENTLLPKIDVKKVNTERTTKFEATTKRDEAYYSDPAKVLADLEAYAKASGKEDLRQLSIGFKEGVITCQNGEAVTFNTYVTNAGTALGMAEKAREARGMLALIRDRLLEIAEVEVRDKAYYSDPVKVRADLEAYSKASGKEDPRRLSASFSSYNTSTTCQNGEAVNFGRYLNNAGVALGMAENNNHAARMNGAIIDRLLEIAEVEVRDNAYYSSPAKVRADLKAYAKASGQADLSQFSTTSKEGTITCQNGEAVSFGRYLKNAGVALGVAENDSQAATKLGEIRDKLLEIAEVEVRDNAYYSNPAKVRADLEAYAKASGLADLSQLSTTSKEGAITCQNGEAVSFGRYLKNAGVALGMAESSNQAGNMLAAIRDQLFEIAEVETRDETYYNNQAKVRADLEAYAKASGLADPRQLSVGFNGSITCQNGDVINFKGYLKNAGVTLGIAESGNQAGNMLAAIRDRLLKIAGFRKEKYKKRDKAYYSNPAKVRADLEAYAKASGLADPRQLSVGFNESIICQNGDVINFSTYVRNAGVALGMAEKAREAGGMLAQIRDKLLEIAEVEVRDKVYYNNQAKVRADLEAYAKASGLADPRQLSVGFNGSITCQNGDVINFKGYLKNAGVALGMAENNSQAKGMLRAIRDRLLEIAGLK